MLRGLAASLLQDVLKSIGGGVVVLWCGSMRLDYAVIRCRMEWKTSAIQQGEVQKVKILDRSMGKRRRRLSREL